MNNETFQNLSKSKKIPDIINSGKIDQLKQLYPDAKSLVAVCENCESHDFDIMGMIAQNANTEMLKNIMDEYFNKGSLENDQLKKKFLLSHHKDERPKDFHFFKQYLPENTHEQLRILFSEKLSPEPRHQQSEKMADLYNLIKEEFLKSDVRQFSRDTRSDEKNFLNFHPDGTISTNPSASDESYVTNTSSNTNDVYPNLVLERFEKNENGASTGMVNSTVLTSIPFDKDGDLAISAYKMLPFPDIYFEDRLFQTLRVIDYTYKSIKNDEPLAQIYLNGFQGSFVVQNTKEPYMQKASNYLGYSDGKNIAIRSKENLDLVPEVILHELTHHADKDFRNMDIYNFTSMLMYANKDASEDRNYAVSNSLYTYNQAQYSPESLARVMQKYPQNKHKDDRLLAATSELFAVYSKASTNDDPAILNRLMLSMRMRLPNYSEYAQALNQMAENQESITKRDTQSIEDRSNEFKSIISHNPRLSEDMMIDAIEKEIKYAKKIQEVPNASKVMLQIDTIGRDGLNDNDPLEILVANAFNKEIDSANKNANEQKIKSELESVNLDNAHKKFMHDDANGQQLDRDNLENLITEITKRNIHIQSAVTTFFPNAIKQDTITIQECMPILAAKSIIKSKAIIDNIELSNSYDENIKINLEAISNPFHNLKTEIEKADKEFKEKPLQGYINDFNNLASYSKIMPLQFHEYVSGLRMAQNIYQKFNPESEIPDDLKISNLAADTMTSANGAFKISETFTKYTKEFDNQLKRFSALDNVLHTKNEMDFFKNITDYDLMTNGEHRLLERLEKLPDENIKELGDHSKKQNNTVLVKLINKHNTKNASQINLNDIFNDLGI